MEDNIKRKVNICLFAMLGSDELVKKWWTSPNLAFENKTPAEVFEVNQKDVIDYVLGYMQR